MKKMDPNSRTISLSRSSPSSSSTPRRSLSPARPSSAAALLVLLFCLSSSAAYGEETSSYFNITSTTFNDGYRPLFGDGNVVSYDDATGVRLLLDRFTGAGFISSNMYQHGFFSANIKLPGDYTAGIVVAFYTSNGDVFEKTHDELDIEFLGNVEGKEWRFQTNVYGNGSTNRGREERYTLWFDPTVDFHRYSILWTPSNIIFYVDDVPIREIVRSEAMGGDFPSKPMSLYATIWDASDWATQGGRFKVNYKYAPFVAEFKDLTLDGCVVDPLQQSVSSAQMECSEEASLLQAKVLGTITPKRRAAMRSFRSQYMYYAYCYDSIRYPVTPPECVIDPVERTRFHDTGRLKPLKFGGSHTKRRSRRRSRGSASSKNQADI